ncbi:MAG: hypothetical protein WCO02_05545 [Bacteroidota bacterium]
MKKIFIMLMIGLLFAAAVNAQEETQKSSFGYKPSSYYSFGWNTLWSVGNFNKWVANGSPAGFNLGGRYFIPGTNLAAGFNIQWQNVWQEYPAQTYYGSNGLAITAMNYRSTWMVPFQAAIDYYFIPSKMISPYISLGIGGDYMEHHLLIQEFDIYKSTWDFSLTPEIGALIKFGAFSNWGANVAFNYKWTTNKIEFYNGNSLKNLSMIQLRVGLCYILR